MSPDGGAGLTRGDRGQFDRKLLCAPGGNWEDRGALAAHSTSVGKGGAALDLEGDWRISGARSLESSQEPGSAGPGR